jgi:hypothetical protein
MSTGDRGGGGFVRLGDVVAEVFAGITRWEVLADLNEPVSHGRVSECSAITATDDVERETCSSPDHRAGDAAQLRVDAINGLVPLRENRVPVGLGLVGEVATVRIPARVRPSRR